MQALPAPYAGRGRTLLARLVAIGAGQAVATTAAALLVREGFHGLRAGADTGHMAVLAVGLVMAAAASGWLRARERVVAERLGQGYAYRVRSALLRHIERVAPRALEGRASGAVLLRFVGDVTALRQWVSLGLSRLVVVGTATAVSIAVLAVLDPLIAGAVAVTFLAGGAITVSLGTPLRASTAAVRRRRARLAGLVGERLSAVAVIQAFGQAERERRRARRRARQLRDAMVDRARIAGRIQGAATATGGLVHASALLAGGVEVSAGRASPGTVVAALLVASALASRLPGLGRVQELWQGTVVARAKAERFLALPKLPAEPDEAPALKEGPGRLELRNVTVAGVLEGVSATAEPGAVVAVTGANGAGKTTLLGVVAGLVPPDSGAIELDHKDLAVCRRDSVRWAVGVIGPDLPLLRGSVEENVRYRWRDAPPEELARVQALCKLDELYAELPDGAAARVQESGRGLSAGQRQRIAIARALVGRPRVLLFDEADAHLDPKAAAVLDVVLEQHDGCALVVTHHPERIRADAVWLLDGGHLEVFSGLAASPDEQGLSAVSRLGGRLGRLIRPIRAPSKRAWANGAATQEPATSAGNGADASSHQEEGMRSL